MDSSSGPLHSNLCRINPRTGFRAPIKQIFMAQCRRFSLSWKFEHLRSWSENPLTFILIVISKIFGHWSFWFSKHRREAANLASRTVLWRCSPPKILGTQMLFVWNAPEQFTFDFPLLRQHEHAGFMGIQKTSRWFTIHLFALSPIHINPNNVYVKMFYPST